MNDLQVFTHDNVDVVDSRAVAEMVGKNHRDLMRSIHGYIDVMEKSTERNFAPSDFFIPRTYKDSTGRTLPCYLLTKKGCDMVANKMTGEKGVLFTAAYVTAFESMRKSGASGPGKPMTGYQQMMAETRRQNLAVQRARILNQIAAEYEGTTYKQVLQAHATKELTGEYLLPLPKLEAKTYSAQEVGDILGISANQVGRLANQNHLKDPGHGQWFKDKSPYGNKEVSTFRYYENTVDALRKILAQSERKEA
jgi:Rha family phage regulatory protein